MDSSAAATGPLVVLGAAGLGLLVVLVVAAVRLPRSEAPRPVEQPETPGPASGFHGDDLPGFHARPPGFPGAAGGTWSPTAGPVPLAAPAARPSPRAQLPPSDDARGVPVARFLLALVALALLLIAAAAAVALPSAGRSAAATPAPSSDRAAPPLPDLPSLPDAPAPGDPGAGRLAYTSLPLGEGDVAARLAFGSQVLEQQAVGVTATSPAAGLTTHGDLALVHLRLPTSNCLTPDAPVDPVAVGCVPSVTEYADLASPALRMSRDGTSLLLSGRFPSYTRPNGSGPVYTGRVYDVTLTVAPGRRLGPGRWLAEGALSLGAGTTRTDDDPRLDVLIGRR